MLDSWQTGVISPCYDFSKLIFQFYWKLFAGFLFVYQARIFSDFSDDNSGDSMKYNLTSGEVLTQAKSAVEESRELIIRSKESQKRLQEFIAIQRANLGKTYSEIRAIESPKFKR